MWAVLTSLLIIERLLQIFMTVKTSAKIIIQLICCKNKKPPSATADSGLFNSICRKPLSANADNDDNANADKNIRRGDLAAGKCRTKIAVCVTHQLWLSSQFKD
jgi:hypothetical protein